MRTIDKRINGFTRTEWKLLQVLRDGKPHTRKELHACLPDELSNQATIKRHLSCLRRKLPANNLILCVWHTRRFCYQLVLSFCDQA